MYFIVLDKYLVFFFWLSEIFFLWGGSFEFWLFSVFIVVRGMRVRIEGVKI